MKGENKKYFGNQAALKMGHETCFSYRVINGE
jgi:hypothetical protein